MVARNGDVDFWALVDKRGPVPKDALELGRCWLWRGARNHKGEPVYLHGNRRRIPHRYAWTITTGHRAVTSLGSLCWNAACVRPDHRAPGVAWRARLHRCKFKHSLAIGDPNTNIRPDGKRQCRKCAARRVREMYARRREARNCAAMDRTRKAAS